VPPPGFGNDELEVPMKKIKVKKVEKILATATAIEYG
jgi:hypothetical protein